MLRWQPGLRLDAEDSLDLESAGEESLPPVGAEVLRVAVVRFPRLSNVTDVDALGTEPGVVIRLVTRPGGPGGRRPDRAPRHPGDRLRSGLAAGAGLDAAVARLAASGVPVLGVCGGYQMLGGVIDDDVESKAGRVSGLGLLPVTTTFGVDKVLRQAAGSAAGT